MDRTEGFGVYLDRTLKKVQSTFLQVFAENNINLTIEQWVILQKVYLLGDKASQAEISKTNYRNRATTSRVISGLSEKGLLKKQRFDDDQKRFQLVLTKAGEQLIQKTLPIISDIRKMSTQNISHEEFDIFIKVLNQIWDNYDRYEAEEG